MIGRIRLALVHPNPWIRVTGVYGVPEVARRHRTWDFMRRLSEESTMPWFIGGDFNEVLKDGEKVGGNNRALWQMTGFNSALMNCDLTDLGFEGYPFTWSNGRAHPNTVRCRLDRPGGSISFPFGPCVTFRPTWLGPSSYYVALGAA